jgi:hypothetical protein
MTHYKSLISIITTCKYVTSSHAMPCHISLLKNISKNSRSMPHHLVLRYLFSLKNNSKNSKKSPHGMSPFSIKK